MSAVGNVIRAEWFRLLHKRRLYLLAGLYWLLLPLIVLVVAVIIYANVGGSFVNQEGELDAIFQAVASPFGMVRLMLAGPAFMSPTFYIIAVTIIAALLIGDERTQNMWKTVLVVQPDRWAVMTGKVVTAMLVLGALLLGGAVAGLLFGTVGSLLLPVSFATGTWGSLALSYLVQWLQLLAPVLLAFLLIGGAFRGVRCGACPLPTASTRGHLHGHKHRARTQTS